LAAKGCRRWLAGLVLLGLLLCIGAGGLLLGWRLWMYLVHKPSIFSLPSELPAHGVAIVFGAEERNGRPSAALADRIEAAAELYHSGKVRKLLMTGDNRFVNYNEPQAMRDYALQLGVPEQDIVLDYAGRRTYDSCYRARAIFGVEEAVLVTQAFHLPRAMYLCQHLGVQPVGYVAHHRYFSRRLRLIWNLRETLACAAAWFDVNIRQPVPVLGEPLPIDVSE
jgi:SanA protein